MWIEFIQCPLHVRSVSIPRFIEGAVTSICLAFVDTDDTGVVLHVRFDDLLALNAAVFLIVEPVCGIGIFVGIRIVFHI